MLWSGPFHMHSLQRYTAFTWALCTHTYTHVQDLWVCLCVCTCMAFLPLHSENIVIVLHRQLTQNPKHTHTHWFLFFPDLFHPLTWMQPFYEEERRSRASWLCVKVNKSLKTLDNLTFLWLGKLSWCCKMSVILLYFNSPKMLHLRHNNKWLYMIIILDECMILVLLKYWY